jgi:hypothetical protein
VLILVLKTSGLISSCYIGSHRGRGLVGRGEMGQWVEGRGTVAWRGTAREGESITRRMGRPLGLSGGKRGRRGRQGRKEAPAHVAQTGTLMSQRGYVRRGRFSLHRRATLD